MTSQQWGPESGAWAPVQAGSLGWGGKVPPGMRGSSGAQSEGLPPPCPGHHVAVSDHERHCEQQAL